VRGVVFSLNAAFAMAVPGLISQIRFAMVNVTEKYPVIGFGIVIYGTLYVLRLLQTNKSTKMLECGWRGDILGTSMHLSFEKKIVNASCDLYHSIHSSTSSLKQLTLKLSVVYSISKVKDILESFPLPLHSASLSLVLDRKISDAATVEEEVTLEIILH
jgi:hypothetical protein